MHRFGSVLLASAIVVGCTATTAKNGGAGGLSGTVYFSQSVDIEIHALDLASGADTKLGKGVAADRAPDGKLVYTSPNDLVESPADLGTSRTIVAHTLDKNPQTSAGFVSPQVSPDGTKVSYVTNLGDLFVVDRASGALVSSFQNGGGTLTAWDRPTWTPDGRIVAGGSFQKPGFWLSNAELSDWERIDADFPQSMFADPTYPCVSPDGTKLTFVRDKRVEVMNMDGTGVVVLDTDADETTEDRWPTWSPDGSHIAYFTNAGHMKIRPATGGAAVDVLDTYPALADAILIFQTSAQFDWAR